MEKANCDEWFGLLSTPYGEVWFAHIGRECFVVMEGPDWKGQLRIETEQYEAFRAQFWEDG